MKTTSRDFQASNSIFRVWRMHLNAYAKNACFVHLINKSGKTNSKYKTAELHFNIQDNRKKKQPQKWFQCIQNKLGASKNELLEFKSENIESEMRLLRINKTGVQGSISSNFFHARTKNSYVKTMMKLTTRLNFINVIRAAFGLADPKSVKKDSKVVSLFCAFGICEHKSCS